MVRTAKLFVFGIFVVAAALGASRAVPAQAQKIPANRTLHKTVRAGAELRVATYTQHTPDCRSGRNPQISVTGQPGHGTLDIRPDTVVMRESRTGTAASLACIGSTLTGLGVFYTPAAGFSGTDQFDYYIISNDNTAHDMIVVTVQPSTGPN
jgi:hypothetical protein